MLSNWCAVCSAPKRRFKPYEPAVSKNANEREVRKARKAQIQKDEAIGYAIFNRTWHILSCSYWCEQSCFSLGAGSCFPSASLLELLAWLACMFTWTVYTELQMQILSWSLHYLAAVPCVGPSLLIFLLFLVCHISLKSYHHPLNRFLIGLLLPFHLLQSLDLFFRLIWFSVIQMSWRTCIFWGHRNRWQPSDNFRLGNGGE